MPDATVVQVSTAPDSTVVRVPAAPDTTTVQVVDPDTTSVVVSGDSDTTVVSVGPAATTIVATGEIGPRGAPGGHVLDIVAAQALSGHRVVVPDDTGQAAYADPTNAAHLDRPMWLTTSAVSAGAAGELVAIDEVTEPSWAWTPGLALYLGLNGTLTQVPPPGAAFWRKVGAAITATRIFFDPETPIRLS